MQDMQLQGAARRLRNREQHTATGYCAVLMFVAVYVVSDYKPADGAGSASVAPQMVQVQQQLFHSRVQQCAQQQKLSCYCW
jgi:hypothetical protein